MDVTELADWREPSLGPERTGRPLSPCSPQGQAFAQQRVPLLLQCKGRTEHVPKKQKGWKEALLASTALELRAHCAESLHHALERRESHWTVLFFFFSKTKPESQGQRRGHYWSRQNFMRLVWGGKENARHSYLRPLLYDPNCRVKGSFLKTCDYPPHFLSWNPRLVRMSLLILFYFFLLF